MEEITLGDLYSAAKADIDALDARLLIKHVLNLSESDFIAHGDKRLNTQDCVVIHKLIHRRKQGEPVSKIIGLGSFWSRDFIVTPDVLDPRPDTEMLIEVALQGDLAKTILDIGAGTGCIPITLALEWKTAQAVSVDISPEALDVARRNADMHGVSERVTFIQSNLDNSVDNSVGDNGRFDLITSNPPYIPQKDIESLQVDVKNHDPILALDGGVDGLDFYKKIVGIIKKRLKPKGRALLEIGVFQDKVVSRLVEDQGMIVNRIVPDLGGVPRVVEISLGKT